VLSLAGALVDSATGSIAYVAAIGTAAMVVLLVAAQAGGAARAWRFIGIGISIWTVTAFLVTLVSDADVKSIPDLVINIGYTVGYLPVLLGLAELADPRLKVRRWSGLVDGVLVFLVLYGVIWLLVVEAVAYDSELPVIERAFSSLYPAGDIAMVMLAVRVMASRMARRRVALLLVGGSLLCAIADTMLMVLYLVNPDGEYPITDLLYMSGLATLALAALWSLLPAPPPVADHRAASRRAPVLVTSAAVIPALVLLGVVAFTDRNVALVPVAVWLAAMVLVLALRSMSGVRALEEAHQQALWLASHDLATGALMRSAFLHEVSEGSLRDRSGTIIVLELQGSLALADAEGLDLADAVRDALVVRLRHAVGPDALIGRLSSDRVAAFMRASDLGRGRQVVQALERSLTEPIAVDDRVVRWVVCGGVAQADGAVIDAHAGLRRATEVMRHARGRGPGVLLFDADLAGRVEPPAARPVASAAVSEVSGRGGRVAQAAASTTTVS